MHGTWWDSLPNSPKGFVLTIFKHHHLFSTFHSFLARAAYVAFKPFDSHLTGHVIDRDTLGVGSKVIPEEHEKRRAVFWELLNLDCRMVRQQSPIVSIQVDFRFLVSVTPSTTFALLGPCRQQTTGLWRSRSICPKRRNHLYVRFYLLYFALTTWCISTDHEWKNSFLVKCLTPILESMVSVQQPAYSKILELDKYVRDFGVPGLLEDATSHSVSPRFLVMQRGLVALGREIGEAW